MRFIAVIFHYAFSLYELGLLAYVICSWIPHPSTFAFRTWLAQWYEPVLTPIRRKIPAPRWGVTAIDLSPIVLYFGLGILKHVVFSLFVWPA